MWLERVTWYPQVGKQSEVRGIAVDLAKWHNEQGIRALITQVVAGAEAGTVVGDAAYESLGDYEASRKARQEDPQVQSLLAKMGPLLRAPSKIELLEVVISFPT